MSEFLRILENAKKEIQSKMNELPEEIRIKIEEESQVIANLNKNINEITKLTNDKSNTIK